MAAEGSGWLTNCEELVGPPDRRDAKPRSLLQAEIRLTTLCIDGQGFGAPWGLPPDPFIWIKAAQNGPHLYLRWKG